MYDVIAVTTLSPYIKRKKIISQSKLNLINQGKSLGDIGMKMYAYVMTSCPI